MRSTLRTPLLSRAVDALSLSSARLSRDAITLRSHACCTSQSATGRSTASCLGIEPARCSKPGRKSGIQSMRRCCAHCLRTFWGRSKPTNGLAACTAVSARLRCCYSMMIVACCSDPAPQATRCAPTHKMWHASPATTPLPPVNSTRLRLMEKRRARGPTFTPLPPSCVSGSPACCRQAQAAARPSRWRQRSGGSRSVAPRFPTARVCCVP